MAAAARPTTNQSMNPDNPPEDTVAGKKAVGIGCRQGETMSQAAIAGYHPRNLATKADIGVLRSTGQRPGGKVLGGKTGYDRRSNDVNPPMNRSADAGQSPASGGTRA